MTESLEHKPVHPTTDKTWRNATYDLSKVPLEAARVFYRTRLEVASDAPSAEPWQTVVQVLLKWATGKERRRQRDGLANLSDQLPERDALMSSDFARGGFHKACGSSYLRTEAAFADDSDVLPRHWALEYVERDSSFGYRFWVTELGISELGAGSWAVNARVRYYDDPTYIYEVEAPKRNAPRFVRDLILAPGLRISCGGVSLRTSADVLTEDNFDLFVEQLIDPERTAPIVVVSRHERKGSEPDYPVDPLGLARLLAGVALVYALDRNDEALERSYRYVFDNPDKPAYKYRLVPGCLRIFWAGVDLDEPSEYDYARHRFFTSEALEQLGAEAIIQNISAGVSRMFSLRAGEVLSIRSVAYQASLLRTGRLEQTRKSLVERLREAEGKREALEGDRTDASDAQESLEAFREEVALLNELLATADDEIEELKARQGQAPSGVSEDEYLLQGRSLEQAQLEAMTAQERADELDRDNGRLRYRINQLEAETRSAEAQAAGNQAMADLFLEACKDLRDPERVMDLAKQAFAGRMVILDEAVDSARDFMGDAGEMFEGLSALYQYLWPMRFGLEGGASVDVDEFESQSGFGIAFHESKQTNKDARLVRMRQRTYRGKTCDITPHIKGGDKRRGHLRIHFAFDDERQLIVVGHCGGHLETYGTQRM